MSKKSKKLSALSPENVTRKTDTSDKVKLRLVVIKPEPLVVRRFSFWDGFIAPLTAILDALFPKPSVKASTIEETSEKILNDRKRVNETLNAATRKALGKYVRRPPAG